MTSSGTMETFSPACPRSGQLLHKVGGHALLFQHLHEVVGDFVVDNALAGWQGAAFLPFRAVASSLVGNHDQIGGRRWRRPFGFAFVKLLSFSSVVSLRIIIC